MTIETATESRKSAPQRDDTTSATAQLACNSRALDGGGRLHVAVVESMDGLDRLREGWNALMGDNPMLRWEWASTWWRHYGGPNDCLHVITVRDEADTLVGVAPLYLTVSPWLGRFIRFLGSGEVCSDYTTVLAAPGYQEAVANELAGYLTQTADVAWDIVELSGVAADDPAIVALRMRLAALGVSQYASVLGNCWRVDFPASWEAYVATLSKSRRERVRQLIRRGFDTGRAKWRLAETPDDLQRGYELLIDLHQRRRASMGQRGCFASRRFYAFHREILQTLHAQGRARLHWTEVDGAPVAVEYDLVGDDVVYLYQSGMDPDKADERPGWLGVIASLRSAIDQGYSAFDFLRGDEAYKAHWRAEGRPLATVHVVAHGLVARWRYRTLAARARLHSSVKRALVAAGAKESAS